MRERNSKQSRLSTESKSNASKSNMRKASKHEKKDPFAQLQCSPAMKKLILSEFEREKVCCNFLPEKQVAMGVIHRYRSFIANYSRKYKGVSPSSPSKKVLKVKRSAANIGGKKSKAKKGEKKVPSIGDSGFLDDSDKEFEIQEFDETNFPVPAEGSFSLQPSPAVLKLQKQLLVRYNSDDDTEEISDSSPAKLKHSTIIPE